MSISTKPSFIRWVESIVDFLTIQFEIQSNTKNREVSTMIQFSKSIQAVVVCVLTLVFTANVAFAQNTMTPDPDSPNPITGKETLFLEQMTWMEVRDAMAAGKNSVIIATGGVEQNGPYMESGAHQLIVGAIAQRIAEKLGNALIAPIISYVPEGDIDPPTGHMLYPSTLSVSEETFQAIISDAANSLRVHGFENIILIGDSGGNQRGMNAVANKLTEQWSGEKNQFGKLPRIHFIGQYYDNARWNQWLADQGYVEVDEDIHDDLRHESILMAVDPEAIRLEQRKAAGLASINSVSLLSENEIAQLGERLIDFHADVAVSAIETAISN